LEITGGSPTLLPTELGPAVAWLLVIMPSITRGCVAPAGVGRGPVCTLQAVTLPPGWVRTVRGASVVHQWCIKYAPSSDGCRCS
jgi:hypothetical protein